MDILIFSGFLYSDSVPILVLYTIQQVSPKKVTFSLFVRYCSNCLLLMYLMNENSINSESLMNESIHAVSVLLTDCLHEPIKWSMILLNRAWMFYHQYKKHKRAEMARKMKLAAEHYDLRKQRVHFTYWLNWVRFARNRLESKFWAYIEELFQ